jgi:hypothetical protein
MNLFRPGDRISPKDIDKITNPFRPEYDTSWTTPAGAECLHIEKALVKCGGMLSKPTGGARLLGLPLSTLQIRLKKCGLNPCGFMNRRALQGGPCRAMPRASLTQKRTGGNRGAVRVPSPRCNRTRAGKSESPLRSSRRPGHLDGFCQPRGRAAGPMTHLTTRTRAGGGLRKQGSS